MAYVTSNPPAKMTGPLTGAGQVWMYRSTDVATDVDATGYFTNGKALGMRVGDVVIVCDTDTSTTMTIHRVTVIETDGSVTISTTGTNIA
jgi:hypothetical protein